MYVTATTSDEARPSFEVEGVRVARNSTLEDGGALYCGLNAEAKLINTEVWGNSASSGGAFFSDSCGLELLNCTVASNLASGEGGALLTTSTEEPNERPQIDNSILWGNLPNEIVVLSLGLPEVTFSDVQGGWPGNENIDVDPLFVDPNPISGDYQCRTRRPGARRSKL